VTALVRDRRLETLRPGDYAEIAGDWTGSGVFEGLRLEDSQGRRGLAAFFVAAYIIRARC
jgi:hypothetical protein